MLFFFFCGCCAVFDFDLFCSIFFNFIASDSLILISIFFFVQGEKSGYIVFFYFLKLFDCFVVVDISFYDCVDLAYCC